MKRIIITLMAVVIAVPLLFLAGLLFVGPWVNDCKAAQVTRELKALALPDDTQAVETVSFCGNTSGTGNHVEIWAGILLQTTLPEEDLTAAFGEPYVVEKLACQQDVDAWIPSVAAFTCLPDDFTGGDGGQYYLLYIMKEPLTQWDIRGH